MTPERWQQVREILYAASRLDGGARSQFLEQNCAGDAALREEVERLLSALEQSAGFLEKEPEGAANSPELRIGPYIVLEQAGRGGMGVVYHAVREGDYRQEVALKLVRAGAETEFLVTRFRLERQALAMLNHPNIARLLDGGTIPDGRPYLVMEWVEGEPITEHCRARSLGVGERLKLFLSVCEAVEHAHRNLVVHRDLKPSNILITGDGSPKLLDFGIAKIFSPEETDETLTTTLAGMRLLTPEYASPEQVRGEAVTTATDVYSLGAVLYEVLTDRRPLKMESRTPAEIERTICTQEPAPPSGATQTACVTARELRGDLDNIVLKALQKEAGRRYGSAGQFAEDIRRYLQGLTVMARKDTFWYRSGKFARRHRAGVAAAAVVALAVAAGTATTLWEGRVAVEQQRRAERRFNDVRRLANSFLFEFDDAIKNLPGSTPARALVVKRALEYLDSLAAEGRGDRSLQMEIASAYQRVGEVQGDPMFPNLGDSKGALASSEKALGIRERLAGADPGNRELKLGLASIHQQISDILDFSGNSAGALEHSGQALRLYEALAGSAANDAKVQIALAIQTYHHANLLKRTGDIEGAVAGYRRAVELSTGLVAAYPSDAEGKVHLASSLDGLGNVLQEKGDTASALENRRKGLALREDLAASDPQNAHYRRQLGFSHHNVGLSLMQAGEMPAALGHFRVELGLFESLSAADPNDAQGRRNRSLAHKQIGDAMMRMADWGGALGEYRKSLEIDRGLSAADEANAQAVLDLSFSEGKVGAALGKLGRSREALAVLRSGVMKQESLAQKDPNDEPLHAYLANSYTRLGNCLLESGDGNGAIEYYRKAVAARLTLLQKNRGGDANRGALAECYTNLGKAVAPRNGAEALEHYGKAVELLEHLTNTDRNNAEYRIRLADSLTSEARVYVRMASAESEIAERARHWIKARTLYQRSQELWSGLERAGRLSAADVQSSREAARELTVCDRWVTMLQKDR